LTIEDTVVGLIGGFALSMITFYVGMKITGMKERRERLRKHIRKLFPILRELGDDLSYAISIKMRSEVKETRLDDLSQKIAIKLNSFVTIYSNFRAAGLEPELDSSDEKMSNELKGLFTSWKMDDQSAVSNKLDLYRSKVIVCKNLLESYLKR